MLVGVDTGGTFTDLVAVVDGRLCVTKVRSTPADPASAVLTGVDHLAPRRPFRLHYGSTVATNALLERRGARVVLLTTAGFEDVLEIGRQVRSDLYALHPTRTMPLVPASRRLGVAERLTHDGAVLVPLGRRELDRLRRAVMRAKPDAIAVCLLHAYADPRHERVIARHLADGAWHVTESHRLSREHREYERTSTTVVNAFVGPLMRDHIARLGRETRVMQSSGGLVTGATAAAEPVRTVLSGPAAGVVGAAACARRAGLERIITLDMGGTSTDVSLIDGSPAMREETSVGGHPVRLPSIDIHTVGAGGGSLARLDAGGALRVGPESAGADPGPACYGRGTAATVTDAHLVLGRLVATEFLGGAMTLDERCASAAVARLARALGRSTTAAAAGILTVATAAMERALRVITVERGHDPRAFTLLAFGGAGGLHAAELAEALGMRRVYVPALPGLLSAWGSLTAPAMREVNATWRLVDPAPAVVRARLGLLERDARRALARDGERPHRIERLLDVRYVGQGHELVVPAGPRWRAAFDRLHAQRFGHASPARSVEVVSARVSAIGRALAPPPTRPSARGTPRPVTRQRTWFTGAPKLTRVFRRDALPAGWSARGPLVICEYSATTLVPPGWRLSVDRSGGLMLERSRE